MRASSTARGYRPTLQISSALEHGDYHVGRRALLAMNDAASPSVCGLSLPTSGDNVMHSETDHFAKQEGAF
jgi:hypothetical protein